MDRWTGRTLGLLLVFVLAMVGVFLVTNTNLFGRGARQDPRFEDVGGTPAAATTDVEVPPGLGISASSRHSATTRPDGTAWMWGTGLYGRLGDGSNDNQDTPVRVRGLTKSPASSQAAITLSHSAPTAPSGRGDATSSVNSETAVTPIAPRPCGY